MSRLQSRQRLFLDAGRRPPVRADNIHYGRRCDPIRSLNGECFEADIKYDSVQLAVPCDGPRSVAAVASTVQKLLYANNGRAWRGVARFGTAPLAVCAQPRALACMTAVQHLSGTARRPSR